MTEPQNFDWPKIDENAIPELLRQGELCLSGLLSSAIAADQRATALCGILGAAGVALLAGTATIVVGSQPNTELVFGAVATAVPLLLASLLAGLAGRPVDFFMTGYEPRLLAQGASNKNWMLRYTIIDVQKRIDANRARLATNSRLVSFAFAVAALSVITGIATFAVIKYPSLRPLFGTVHSAAEPVAVLRAVAEVQGLRTFCVPLDSTRELLVYQNPCE